MNLDPDPVETFSGSHPFRPQCLRETLADDFVHEGYDRPDALDEVEDHLLALLDLVDAHRCVRCGAHYNEREIPSGSRQTSCRCIPVCSTCGQAEAVQWVVLVEICGPEDSVLGGMIAPVTSWPINPGAQNAALAEWDRRHPIVAVSMATLTSSGHVLTEDGVGTVDMTPRSGGWAEHGYDDSADRVEKER